MADEPKTTSSGGSGMSREVENALWGALLTGGLGAVAGGLATKPDEDLTPGEQFKQRLKNALLVGIMGAAGGGGAGYLLTNAGIVGDGGKDTPAPGEALTDKQKSDLAYKAKVALGERTGAAAAGGLAGSYIAAKAMNGAARYYNWSKYLNMKGIPGLLVKSIAPIAGAAAGGAAGNYGVDYIQDGKPIMY